MWLTFLRTFFQTKKTLSLNENKSMERKVWRPEEFLNVAAEATNENYAIIVLNRPIKIDSVFAKQLWEKAKLRCLVDGGANRWLDFIEQYPDLGNVKPPELLTGDFDSITERTKTFFRKCTSTAVIHTPNQDYTDFTKSLMESSHFVSNENIGSIVVLLDTSGRIDHIFAHINTLVKARKFLENVDIFILCKDSIAWLLGAGHHTIHVPKKFVDKRLWCSFAPIDGKCCVSTTGFKWNLDNQFVQFGGIVSTSNTYSSDVVTLQSDGFLYWSMGITEDES